MNKTNIFQKIPMRNFVALSVEAFLLVNLEKRSYLQIHSINARKTFLRFLLKKT